MNKTTAALLLSAVLGTGCASFQRPADREWQTLADEATNALKVSRVWVRTQDGSLGQYHCKGSLIELGITRGNPKWLLAHEIGHHLSGRCDESLPSEMEANAGAMRVLEAWGMSEAQAFDETAHHLIGLRDSLGTRQRPGHNYCAELTDLAKRFPTHELPGSAEAVCPGDLLRAAR